MTDKEKYAVQIALVKEECKDVDEDEVAKEFEKYENEFLIPPNDAVRSVILKFQKASGKDIESFPGAAPRVEKKVDRFSELGSCLLYTSPSPRDMRRSRMPSSA